MKQRVKHKKKHIQQQPSGNYKKDNKNGEGIIQQHNDKSKMNSETGKGTVKQGNKFNNTTK